MNKTKKKKLSIWSKPVIGLVIFAFLLAGVFTTVNVGKAQQSASELAEITNFANSLDGNIDAFMAGLAFISKSGSELMGTGAREIFNSTYLSTQRPSTVLPVDNLYVEGIAEFDGTLYLDGATTTEGTKRYFPINPTMTHTATSTNVGTSTNWLVMGYYLNTGDDLIIDDVYMEETTAPALFQFDVRVGTTTCIVAGTACGTDGLVSWTNTSTDTLTASTTVTTTWTTDINGFIDTNTYAGTYYNPISNEGRPTTTQFVLKHGEAIVWSWLATKATSTASYTTDGGFNAVANAGARARLR